VPALADFDAVILAGGRSTRLAGADKPGLEVGGTPMLVTVARAAAVAGARKLIVVGPARAGPVGDALASAAAAVPGGLCVVREEPPGGGPVPALRRGLVEVAAPWLVLLAADLPFLTGGQLSDLLARADGGRGDSAGGRAGGGGAGGGGAGGGGAGGGGAVLTDDDGRPQWLAGCWQTGALRAALAIYQGNSLGGVLAPLSPLLVRPVASSAGLAPWLDCDSPEDLAAARAASLRNRRQDQADEVTPDQGADRRSSSPQPTIMAGNDVPPMSAPINRAKYPGEPTQIGGTS
jgi:molybdopterin-guanine dinucleotide biosynthesis protein A